jgi:hypothetical protein
LKKRPSPHLHKVPTPSNKASPRNFQTALAFSIFFLGDIPYIHTYIHTYIPWIHKFVMATVGCGISHKDTKQTDKCSNNKNNPEIK